VLVEVVSLALIQGSLDLAGKAYFLRYLSYEFLRLRQVFKVKQLKVHQEGEVAALPDVLDEAEQLVFVAAFDVT